MRQRASQLDCGLGLTARWVRLANTLLRTFVRSQHPTFHMPLFFCSSFIIHSSSFIVLPAHTPTARTTTLVTSQARYQIFQEEVRGTQCLSPDARACHGMRGILCRRIVMPPELSPAVGFPSNYPSWGFIPPEAFPRSSMSFLPVSRRHLRHYQVIAPRSLSGPA